MENIDPNFGELLDELIVQFNCDPAQRNELCLLLTSNPAVQCRNSQAIVGKIRKKLARRNENQAIEFSHLAQKLFSRNDISNPSEVIRFMVTYADAAKTQSKAERKERLAEVNEAFNRENVLKSMESPSVINFARTTEVKSPETSDDELLRMKFVCELAEPHKQKILTGRGATESVVASEEMVRQILAALQGVEGRYIRRTRGSRCSFCISEYCAVDDSLRLHLQPLISIADYYSELLFYSRKKSSDLLKQTFLSSIPDALSYYTEVVSSISREFFATPTKVSPLHIYHELGDCKYRLPTLLGIVTNLMSCDGMEIFNSLYKIKCSTPCDQPLYRSVETILIAMSNVIHGWLKEWMVSGSIENLQTKMMIANELVIISGDHWNDFKLDEAAQPHIFSASPKVCKQILVIGKSVALLEKLNIARQRSLRRRTIFSEIHSMTCYFSIPEAFQLFGVVNKLYDLVNPELSNCLFNDYNLSNHFNAIHRHYFVTEEEFALKFYECIKLETGKNLSVLDSQKVFRAYNTAIESCESWPEILARHARIFATCGLKEQFESCNEGVADLCSFHSPRNPCGLPRIYIVYKTNLPLTIVFNTSEMYSYQKAFDFIWPILFTDFHLTDAIAINIKLLKRKSIKAWPQLQRVCFRYALVFSRISRFIYILRSHIHEIVAKYTSDFLGLFEDRMPQTRIDLEKVIDLHKQFLLSIEDGLFLDEKYSDLRVYLIASLSFINEIIELFTSFHLKVENEVVPKVTISRCIHEEIDPQGTVLFEHEEERIQLEELVERISSRNHRDIKNVYIYFSRMMRDVLKELTKFSDVPHFALFLMQLGFDAKCYSSS